MDLASQAHHVGVVGLQPELVEGVGAEHLGVEPHGPALGLAELGAVGLGDQRVGHDVDRGALDLVDEVHAAHEVAPLVVAADLEGAAVAAEELEVVIGLEDLI